jgi:hypothetical protein
MKTLIGKRVVNIKQDAKYVGEIVGFESGVNGGTIVKNEIFPNGCALCTSDLAIEEDWCSEKGYKRLSSYPIIPTM